MGLQATPLCVSLKFAERETVSHTRQRETCEVTDVLLNQAGDPLTVYTHIKSPRRALQVPYGSVGYTSIKPAEPHVSWRLLGGRLVWKPEGGACATALEGSVWDVCTCLSWCKALGTPS